MKATDYKKSNTLFSEFLAYCREEKGLSKHTLTGYYSIWSSFSTFLRNHKLRADILGLMETPVIFIRQSRIQGDTSWTTFHKRKVLKLFCDWLVAKSILPKNPVNDIPSVKINRGIPVFFSEFQMKMVFESLRTWDYNGSSELVRARNYLAVVLLVTCGLRQSELLRLQVSDIDIPRKMIYVRNAKAGSDRIIPLSDLEYNALKGYLELRRGFPDKNLFVTYQHGDKFSYYSLRRIFNRLRDCGFPKKMTPHKLRHTFATLMISKGADIRSVQELLGHKNIATTSRYLHCDVNQLRTAKAKLNL